MGWSTYRPMLGLVCAARFVPFSAVQQSLARILRCLLLSSDPKRIFVLCNISWCWTNSEINFFVRVGHLISSFSHMHNVF